MEKQTSPIGNATDEQIKKMLDAFKSKKGKKEKMVMQIGFNFISKYYEQNGAEELRKLLDDNDVTCMITQEQSEIVLNWLKKD